MINCDWNQTVKKMKVKSVKVTDIGYSLYSDTSLGIKLNFIILITGIYLKH